MLFYELIGCVVFLALCMPFHVRLNPGLPAVPSRSDFLSLLALGSVFTIIPFLLQIHALKHLNAFTVNVFYNLEPVYSILFAALLFGETREVGPSFWIGISLVAISVFLQSRRHNHSVIIRTDGQRNAVGRKVASQAEIIDCMLRDADAQAGCRAGKVAAEKHSPAFRVP